MNWGMSFQKGLGFTINWGICLSNEVFEVSTKDRTEDVCGKSIEWKA